MTPAPWPTVDQLRGAARIGGVRTLLTLAAVELYAAAHRSVTK